MKRPSGTVRFFLLAGITALALAVPAVAQDKGTVTMEEKGIILHPGTKLSQADAKALNDVLKKYDKSLYRIDVYNKNGQKKKSLGQLSDVCLDSAVVSEVAAAKGNANRTLQVIAATNPQRATGAPTNPQHSPSSPTNPLQTPSSPTHPVSTPSSPTNPLSTPSSPTNPLSTPSSPGSPTNPQQTPSATTHPQTTTQNPCVADEKAAKELIDRLKPILEKYSKK